MFNVRKVGCLRQELLTPWSGKPSQRRVTPKLPDVVCLALEGGGHLLAATK